MKKCAKALLSVVLVAGLMAVCGGFASCGSSKQATMYPNKKNGSTYRSY